MCAVIIAVILVGCGKNNEGSTQQNYDNWVAHIEYNGDIYDIEYNSEYRKLIAFKNNEEVGEVDGIYTNNKIRLPETEDSISLDDLQKIADYIYEADLETGSKYLNYLKSSGYEQVMLAETYNYIETYLKDKEDNIKRVILTEKYLISIDSDKIPELNISDYTS